MVIVKNVQLRRQVFISANKIEIQHHYTVKQVIELYSFNLET